MNTSFSIPLPSNLWYCTLNPFLHCFISSSCSVKDNFDQVIVIGYFYYPLYSVFSLNETRYFPLSELTYLVVYILAASYSGGCWISNPIAIRLCFTSSPSNLSLLQLSVIRKKASLLDTILFTYASAFEMHFSPI